MTCGIYKITRKDTGQSYIGLSGNIEKRYYQHSRWHNMETSRIDPAMVKHGIDKFDLEIIEELPYDIPLLMQRERYWIAKYNTYEDDFHYNLTSGGEAPMYGRRHTDATKEKISKANSGENHPFFGRKHTPETKQKLSKLMSGENHPFFGCHHTESTRLKKSRKMSSTGYYRVSKQIDKRCKQGFTWRYGYCDENHKPVSISSVDINKLEEKVKSKGLPWYKFKD